MNRKGFIGGSDLYKLQRGDWHDLWEIKTGRKESEDLSDLFQVQLGTQTEMFNLQWFEKKTGHIIEQLQAEYEMNWQGIPCKGQLDGILDNGDGIECKHTNSRKEMRDMLDAYMGQVQFYMWVSNRHRMHMSVIFGNQWDTCLVKRDEILMTKYKEMIAEFWEYVRSDTPPPKDKSVKKVDWNHVEIDGLVARDASKENYFVDTAQEYIHTLETAKKNESLKKELRSMINDNEREVFCDELSIRRDKRGACRININKGAA